MKAFCWHDSVQVQEPLGKMERSVLLRSNDETHMTQTTSCQLAPNLISSPFRVKKVIKRSAPRWFRCKMQAARRRRRRSISDCSNFRNHWMKWLKLSLLYSCPKSRCPAEFQAGGNNPFQVILFNLFVTITIFDIVTRRDGCRRAVRSVHVLLPVVELHLEWILFDLQLQLQLLLSFSNRLDRLLPSPSSRQCFVYCCFWYCYFVYCLYVVAVGNWT
jgi:hypothetical protein